MNQLRTLWMKYGQTYGCDPNLLYEIYNVIVSTHSEKGRHYHTLSHLEQMLNVLKELTPELIGPKVFYAICFHDYVYNIFKKDNELQSSLVAQNLLVKLNIPKKIIDTAREMIQATKDHKHPKQNLEFMTFLDADMSILGSACSDYDSYLNDLYREYNLIPSIIFKKNRKAFLKQLISEENIFLTETFRIKFEKQARENILKEITLI